MSSSITSNYYYPNTRLLIRTLRSSRYQHQLTLVVTCCNLFLCTTHIPVVPNFEFLLRFYIYKIDKTCNVLSFLKLLVDTCSLVYSFLSQRLHSCDPALSHQYSRNTIVDWNFKRFTDYRLTFQTSV